MRRGNGKPAHACRGGYRGGRFSKVSHFEPFLAISLPGGRVGTHLLQGNQRSGRGVDGAMGGCHWGVRWYTRSRYSRIPSCRRGTMPRDFGRLIIEKLIIHDVPSRRVGVSGNQPDLSEIESPLDATVSNYIRNKLVGTLVNNSFPVVFDESVGSQVPALVFDNLRNQNQDFVQMSQQLATYLYNSQNGNNPDGLLAVVQTSIEQVRCLAILKLEREAGTRVQLTRLNGKQTFDLQHLRDLMLTDKTRVFKVGLFIQEGITLESIEGFVSDNQSGQWYKADIADFFLRKFLGCKLREEPEVVTKNFLDNTEKWINTTIMDPEKKAKYTIAMVAELQKNLTIVNPTLFANQSLEPVDQQPYLHYLERNDIPITDFLKNNNLVAPRLKRVQMDLECDISILGNPEVFEKKVQMEPQDNGETQITIVDRVKHMKGRG